MSFIRKFVYLVTDDAMPCSYSLRRIDMSRFFLPRAKIFAGPPPLEKGRLPPVAERFIPPVAKLWNGSMSFMLLAGRGAFRNEKVVATDQTGRTLLYDAELGVRTLTALTAPKMAPVSLTVGDNLFILDTIDSASYRYDHCFDSLIHCDHNNDWNCHSLPPPPYLHSYHPEREADPAHIISYGLFNDTKIWISKDTLGTHSFDVESGVWSKAGDWVLPFCGQFQYIQELNLWLGLSRGSGEDSIICASDLNASPQIVSTVWEDSTPPDWIDSWSYLVHLGNSKFCHARFFDAMSPGGRHADGSARFVVFTGLEVKAGKEGEQPSVVKHKSVKFSLVYRLMKWVL